MFKIGDKVVFVNATYARGGKPREAMGQSPYHSKYLGKIGEVKALGDYDCVHVVFEDGSSTGAYAWRFELLKDEWVLAPEGYEFQKGQEVKIGKLVDERANGFSTYVGIHPEMPHFEGRVLHVSDIKRSGAIGLNAGGEGFWWNPRWLLIRNTGNVTAPRPQYQKGDKVVVCKNAIIKGGPKWIEEQDACLNEEGIITAIDEKAKVKVYQIATPSGEWWYCEEAFKKTAEFLRAGGKLKRNEAAIKANVDKAVKAWLVKARKEAGRGCCDFAVFTLKNNGEVVTKNNMLAPCHASLHLYNCKEEVVGAIDFPCFGAAKKDKDWEMYADYIINRSPFKIGFHPAPIEEVKENGVRLNINATADQVAGACVALRHGTEWVGHMQQFAWLVKQGMDENAAWLSSFLVQPRGVGLVEFQKAQIGGGHQVICGGMPQDVIFKFLKHGYPDLKRKPYREATNYQVNGGIGYDAYRNGGVLGNALTNFRDKFLKESVSGEGWAQVSTIDKKSVLEFTKIIHEHIQKA